jgi:Gpi18-like mannosyltransferase
MKKTMIKETIKSKYFSFYKYVLAHELLLSLILAITVIGLGLGMGIANNHSVATNPDQVVHYSEEVTDKLSFLANWDGVRYISISQHGYDTAFMTGFFPLYPILILLLNKIIGSALISALIISWVCLVGAIYYYLKIIKHYFKVDNNLDALKASLLFVLFPSGVYLIAAYTESLFALLSLAAIYYALQRKYIKTALLAMLSTATHINGVFVVLLVALILYEEKEKIRNVLLTLVIGSLGLISYMGYLITKYHNPLEFIGAQKDHHWLEKSVISRLSEVSVLDYVLVFAIIWTTLYWWRRRKSFAIYSALYLLIPILGGQFGGYPRYILMVFPLQFMIFEYVKNKKFAYMVVLVLFGMSWTYTLLHYASGYVVR